MMPERESARLELTTPRLCLSRLAEDDDHFILELVNDPDFLRHIGDRGVRSRSDARRYIARCVEAYERHGDGLYGVSVAPDGERAGICGLVRRDYLPDPDVGFAFLPRFRGRGFALESASAVVARALRDARHDRVLAIVSPGNAASIRLLGRLGLTLAGQVRPPGEPADLLVYSSDGAVSPVMPARSPLSGQA